MSEEIIDILDLNETDEIIAEENAPEFATIGAVYADGVTLIFDGQEEATDKHYKVNSSVAFKAGQRVKITKEYGTYVVEYPVDDPGADFSGLPAGGTTGQVLAKASNTNFDVGWSTVSGGLPSGGTTGQALLKSSNADYAAAWSTINEVPSSGTTGYVLTKTSSSYGWAEVSTSVISASWSSYLTYSITMTASSSSATLTPSSNSIVLGAYNHYFSAIYCNRLYLCYSTASSANGYLSRASGGNLQWNGTNIT